MNKETFDRLNLFVSLIRWDFVPNGNALEMTFSFPYYITFDDIQTRLINEAVQEWHKETIRPVISRLYDEFNGKVINQELVELAHSRVKYIDQLMESSKKGLTIKDQLRKRLGLLPDVNNFKIDINLGNRN